MLGHISKHLESLVSLLLLGVWRCSQTRSFVFHIFLLLVVIIMGQFLLATSWKSQTTLSRNFFCYSCGRFDGRKDCLPWWFGSECKAHCIPHDDDVNGHYSCAPDGNKTCLARWFGENCTVFCVPRDDERGHYTCDKEGYRVCLDGYRPPECLNCLLGRYGANCSLTCLGNDTSTFQQGSYYCTDDGAKNCNRWWHGPTCSQYCVPHDDSMHGHYTCDERDGSKVCRLGWEGSSCLDRNQKWKCSVEANCFKQYDKFNATQHELSEPF